MMLVSLSSNTMCVTSEAGNASRSEAPDITSGF